MTPEQEARALARECLETRRWEGNVALMVLDAAFTSVGLNYFGTVVPAVKKIVGRDPSIDLEELSRARPIYSVWKNKRSWHVAKSVSKILLGYGKTDRERIRNWAKSTRLEEWEDDPVGRIKGVGLNTWQYLRMMGGVNTLMPDKIVKRFLEKEYKIQAEEDIKLIQKTEEKEPVFLCWLAWIKESGEHGKTTLCSDLFVQ